MRFGFVPSDLVGSYTSFIAFSFRRPVSRGTQTFRSVRRAEVLLGCDRSEATAGRIPAGRTGYRHLFRFTVPKPLSRGHKLSICAAPIRQKSANRSFLLWIFLLRTEPDYSSKTNLGRRNDMRMPFSFCLLALLGLAGCVAETPVTTTTTEVTRTVTTGPVATGPVTREVLVTQAPPPVRVETRTVAPGPSYVWTNGYWQWTGASYAWVPGHWVERPRPAAVWVEGHWVRRSGGWIWVAGHWQ